MKVMLMGGPQAGRVVEVERPLPDSLRFPRIAKVDVSGMTVPQVVQTILADVYVRGETIDSEGVGVITGYLYAAESRAVRRAKTAERFVEFIAPGSLAELVQRDEDRAAVDVLIRSMPFWSGAWRRMEGK